MSWKLLLSTLLLSLLWAFVLSEENGIMGMVQTGVSFFAILFIISYKNPLAEYNLFKSRVDQIEAGWHTTTDNIFWILCSCVAFTGIYLANELFYESNRTVAALCNLVSVLFAIPARYFNLRHAPEDMQAYIEANKPVKADSEFVTVGRFDDAAKAHEIKDMLEQQGIETILYGENAPAHLGSTRQSPILVRVRLKNRKEAERLMKDLWRNSE